MKDEERLVCNRLLDMANNCYYRNIPVTTDFLDLNSQTLFHSIMDKLPDVRWIMTGGYELAERKIIIFFPTYMDEISDNYIDDFFTVIRIMPTSKNFSEKLNHRDYLGAILNLGITRAKIGDILVGEKCTYFFCSNTIANYIIENLSLIKHTSVFCEITPHIDFNYEPAYEQVQGSIASLRLDSVIALGFNSSRNHLISYIQEGKIAVNGRIITSNAYNIKPGDIISVRGLGKIRFINELTTSKKGRLIVLIHKYI